jgi:hypothetical protein
MHEAWPPEVDRTLEALPENGRCKPKALPPERERERSPTLQDSLRKGEVAEAMPQTYKREVNVLPQESPNQGELELNWSLQECYTGHPVHWGGSRSLTPWDLKGRHRQ